MGGGRTSLSLPQAPCQHLLSAQHVPSPCPRWCWAPDAYQIPLSPPCCCCERLEMLRGIASSEKASQLLICRHICLLRGILCSCCEVFRPFSCLPSSIWQFPDPDCSGSFPLGCYLSSPTKPMCGHGFISQSSSASSSSPGEAPPSRLEPVEYTHIVSFLHGILLP